MERKKKPTKDVDPRPLWRRKTDAIGKLRLRTPGMDPRRAIKPGQYLHADAKQLGTAIKDFDLIEGDVDVQAVIAKITPQVPDPEKYHVEHVNSGWYNVLSPEGKVMNEKKLRSEDAEALRNKLEEEQQ